MARIVILYPNTPDAPFDMDYYTRKHLELVRSSFGDAVERISVYKGLGGPGGTPAAFIVSTAIEFRDMPSLGAAIGQNGEKISQDVPNFTTIVPTIQIEDKIV